MKNRYLLIYKIETVHNNNEYLEMLFETKKEMEYFINKSILKKYIVVLHKYELKEIK